MQLNFKLSSKPSSSSSGSLKIINLNEEDCLAHYHESKKDLFDLLLDDSAFNINLSNINLNKSLQTEEVRRTI